MPECREAVIVGNGVPPSPQLLAELMAGGPMLLCADGGANAVVAAGWKPDYVVGDLDSAAPAGLAALAAEQLVRIDADDTGTDLQKALAFALRMGVRAATLTGVTGGRTDHTLWNLGLLALFAAELRLRMVDEECDIRLVRGRVRFRAAPGLRVSLSPLDGPALGVRTRGLRYPLHGEALASGVRDGISNVVVEEDVEVSVEGGRLLLIIQRQTGGPVSWE